MDEYQNYMKFGMEEDYEGGKWVAGEYYYSKKKEKRKQTKEDTLYGVFNESNSDEEDGGGGKKKRRDGVVSKPDFSKPLNFVSTGRVMPGSETLEKRTDFADQGGERPGLGASGQAGAGLGFELGSAQAEPESGQGGIGFRKESSREQGDDEEAEEEQNEVLQTAFAQRILEGAAKRREMEREQEKEKEKERERSKARSGPGKSKGAKLEIGEFEKHTKGIGMKLMEKMGYSGGGLGKNAQGIATPIEARLRGKGAGLGFNNVSEKEFGLPPPPGKEAEVAEVKPERDDKPKEKLWKKRFAGKKKEYRTAAQLLEERQADGREVTQTVLDMRGAQVRVLTNLEHINEEAADGAGSERVPMPELQHNLRLIVDLAEADIQTCDRRLRHERDSLVLLQKERERAVEQERLQRSQLEALEALLGALDTIQSQVDSYVASPEALGAAFEALKGRFLDEFTLYNIPAVALAHALPMMLGLYRGWDPLRMPSRGVPVMAMWRGLLARDDAPPEYSIFPEAEGEGLDGDAYTHLVREVVLPPVRVAVTNSWEPRDPEPLLRQLEAWDGLLPPPVLRHILENLVMPKLTAAVDAWDPRAETVPIHAWLHPWLPLLGSSMEPLYPPIRYKLGNALQAWHPSDSSALALLSPWRGVFDSASWEQLLVRCILPKLGLALGQELLINPQQQDLGPFQWVMAWAQVVPGPHMVTLLEAAFFPQWQQVLYNWLCSPAPDFAEVTAWYEGWKALLPPEVQAAERIRFQMISALDMMNQAVAGAPVAPPGVRESLAQLRLAAQLGYAPQPHVPPPGPAPDEAPPDSDTAPPGLAGRAGTDAEEMSLREVVESFAQDNDVQFLPKVGRSHEGLPVYAFGAVTVCIDSANQRLLAQNAARWQPVALEQLLEMHRSRGGRWT